MVFMDLGVANHESDVRYQNSKWSTQNGECKELEFHIFSKFSAFLFDIRYLEAFQVINYEFDVFIQKVYI